MPGGLRLTKSRSALLSQSRKPTGGDHPRAVFCPILYSTQGKGEARNSLSAVFPLVIRCGGHPAMDIVPRICILLKAD